MKNRKNEQWPFSYALPHGPKAQVVALYSSYGLIPLSLRSPSAQPPHIFCSLSSSYKHITLTLIHSPHNPTLDPSPSLQPLFILTRTADLIEEGKVTGSTHNDRTLAGVQEVAGSSFPSPRVSHIEEHEAGETPGGGRHFNEAAIR